MRDILIIDYGIGNIRSVMRSIEICGFNPILSSDSKDIKNANKIILTGVGVFYDGMNGLKKRGLIEPIKQFVKSGKYFLGICLGMQMMMSKSYEYGNFDGLNLIEGEVLSFPKPKIEDRYKIPHIGWNSLLKKKNDIWKSTILEDLKDESDVYFVHSYYVKPKSEKNSLANCNYMNIEFCAVLQKNNIYGCQFHPEKSGYVGLSILKNFCEQK